MGGERISEIQASLAAIPSVGCFELDDAGRYVAFDPQHEAALRARGWPGPRVGGACLDALGAEVGKDGRAALERALDEVRAGATADVVLGTGTQAVSMRLHPLFQPEGEVTGALGLHAVEPTHAPGGDESCRATVEKLADGVLNELNNLGVGLEGVSEGLKTDAADGSGAQQLLDDVRSRADAARRLARSIRSHAMPNPTQRLGVDQLLTEIEPRLRQLGPRGSWSTDLNAPGLAVLADPDELGDALAELVRNALEAGAERLSLRSRPTSSGGVQIELVDDGEGMSPEQLRRVFDVFVGSRKHAQGIGLPRARSVVRRHGGHLWLESVRGEGTVARIELPALSRDPESRPDGDALIDERPLDVFVVDDAPEVRRVLGRVLRHAGHEVSEAEDGVDALEKLDARGHLPDVVILDLMMPRMDGVETYRALRARAATLPILITSGYHPSSLGFLATDPRASFLPKPFSPAEVITALDALMRPLPPE